MQALIFLELVIRMIWLVLNESAILLRMLASCLLVGSLLY